jgi:hypothetical protein
MKLISKTFRTIAIFLAAASVVFFAIQLTIWAYWLSFWVGSGTLLAFATVVLVTLAGIIDRQPRKMKR